MEKIIALLAIAALLAWPACNNDTPCPNDFHEYTCQPGQFAARPPVLNIRQGVSPAGEWEVVLLEGWEYELPENQSQWLKLCGDSFRFIPSNKDAVMLAARHLNGVIEVSPYYNENSAQLYYETSPAGWPKVEVWPGQVIGFRYYVVPGAVVTEIDYDGVQYLHSVNHSGITNHVREINFYAGGSVPPVAEISLKKRRVMDCGD